MTTYADIQGEIRRYLLGTLSEDEGRRVEERLMTEEAFLEELDVAEGELIDDYVGGRLGDDERAEFERHFLSNEERRQQLSFTQALGRYATDAAPKADAERAAAARGSAPHGWVERLRAFWGGASWAPRAGLALAAVAVIAFALWVARPDAPRTFVALTLAAGSGDRAAGAQPPRVKLPLDALRVTLTLPAGATPAAAYRAEALTSAGRAEAVEVAGSDERSVTVVVPGARLARGQYAIRLYAAVPGDTERQVGSYLFEVE